MTINILSSVVFHEETTKQEWLACHLLFDFVSNRARQYCVLVTLPAVFQVMWRVGGACLLKHLIPLFTTQNVWQLSIRVLVGKDWPPTF